MILSLSFTFSVSVFFSCLMELDITLLWHYETKLKKVFLSAGSEFACYSNCLVLKIPINDLLNEIKRFLYVRVKVSWYFRLYNY